MVRQMQNLLFEIRYHLSSGFNELSRRSNRVLSRFKSIASNRDSSEQIGAEINVELPNVSPKVGDGVQVNGSNAKRSPSVPARTRKAMTRSRVLNMHSISAIACQVDYLIKQFGLKPQKTGDRIIVTWPTETNLDCDEKQDPLTMEILISAESGLKFRRISGSSYLFPEKIQVILTLMQEYFGW
ncbi:unnamed protein product [Rodentolepis nana]|uniref:CDT1 domain-containing protein n=1 Tax=Rodentolepis nana TaxID=102285 RepID=A0A0R3TSE6_RODNA|nr:unnamed protein product [Rodentolepis nana]